MLQHVAMSVGDPSKPVADADWKDIEFLTLEACENKHFTVSFQFISLYNWLL